MAKSGKERYAKPNFRLQGGIYWAMHPTYSHPSHPHFSDYSHVFVAYTEDDMRKLMGVARWYMAKDKKSGCITDLILVRYASFWRKETPGGGYTKWYGLPGKTIFDHPNFEMPVEQGDIPDKYMKYRRESSVRRMISSGYCRISNKHRIVARIDCEEWREIMAFEHSPTDPESTGMNWVESLGKYAADHYRRCYSRDKVHISSKDEYSLFPGGNDGETEFLPLI